MTDTSKELPELLPCPFCGEDAGDTYYQLGWFISCKHCSASTEVTNAKARAVEAWNRRTPAPQAQRVPLGEVMNLVSEWGMASHANGEAALDAHSPDATPDEIAYADECVQSERAAWKAIEDKLRAHGITQEKQG